MELWLNRADKKKRIAWLTIAHKVAKGFLPAKVLDVEGCNVTLRYNGKVVNTRLPACDFKKGFTIYVKKKGKMFEV